MGRECDSRMGGHCGTDCKGDQSSVKVTALKGKTCHVLAFKVPRSSKVGEHCDSFP